MTHDPEWRALLQEAHASLTELPDDAREQLIEAGNLICDIGERQQIPPRVMAAGIAGLMGSLVLVEVGQNVHDDAVIDRFIAYAHAALHVAVAMARLNAGWRPPS